MSQSAPNPIERRPDGVYRAPDFDQYDWLEHGFGTRVSDAWPDHSRLAMLRQIHSAVVVTAAGQIGFIGEGDALVANQSGLMVGVRTADCVPILLADTRNRAVAAVHAGWRGTASAIVEHTIRTMTIQFGTQAGDLIAAIGPCIGPCCYEVGPEVVAAFREWMPELREGASQKLDLVEANTRQLRRSGVPGDRISAGAPCTFCSPELHSFRRDQEGAGRMVSAIGRY